MKPICVGCERFMRAKRNGYYFIEGKPWGGSAPWDGKQGKGSKGWTAYKVWVGDLYECPTCHFQTVVGVGIQRLAEHYEPDFEQVVKRTGAARLLVKDC